MANIYFGIKENATRGVACGCSFSLVGQQPGTDVGASGCLPLLHHRGSVQLAAVHRRDLAVVAAQRPVAVGRHRHGIGAAGALLGQRDAHSGRFHLGDEGCLRRRAHTGQHVHVGVVRVAAGRRRAVQGRLGLLGFTTGAHRCQGRRSQDVVRRQTAVLGQGSV
jgi:type IV secretory pathway TrbL component